MKRILAIIYVLISFATAGQGITKQFGNGYKNVNGFHYGWFNSTDTIAYFKAAGLLMKKPVLLNFWTTSTRPGSPAAGMLGFNSDSATIEWYSGAGWNQPGAGSGGGSSYTFSTGLTNTAGTVTANIATGMSGGQTVIGSTSTNSGLIFKTTTGVGTTGADYIFTGGNNGATEFVRILNSGNVGIGTNNPATKLAVVGGNSRFDCFDGSNVFGNISTTSSSNSLTLSFNRTLSSGTDRINFNGGNYIMNDPSSGEVRIFSGSGNNFITLYGNGSERIRLPTGGGVTFNTSTNSYTFPTTRASGAQKVLTDVSGNGTLTWETRLVALNGTTTHGFGSLSNNSSATTTISVTGAADGDFVLVTKPVASGWSNGESYTAWVSGPDTVTVRQNNNSGGSVDFGSQTINVKVIKQ